MGALSLPASGLVYLDVNPIIYTVEQHPVYLRDGCSTFERVDRERLKGWLQEYALSELWERNLLAGGPY